MLAIAQMLLPLALKIIGTYFDKAQVSSDQKKSYLDFIATMQKSSTPADIKTSYEDQIKRVGDSSQSSNVETK